MRPCAHNQWVKEGKKRGQLHLRCRVCRTMWKTRPEAHGKCHAFYNGRCTLGDECTRPHIYARRRPGPAQHSDSNNADEVSEPGDGHLMAAIPLDTPVQELDTPVQETVISLNPFADAPPPIAPLSATSLEHTPVGSAPDSADVTSDGTPSCSSTKKVSLVDDCEDGLEWRPSSEPTEYDMSAFC